VKIEERRSALLEQPRKEESQCFAVFVLRRHSFPDGKNVVKQQAFPFRSLQCRQRFFMIQTKQMTVVRESYPPTPATCRCGSEDQMPLTESVTKHTTGQNCCTRTELQGLRPRQHCSARCCAPHQTAMITQRDDCRHRASWA
jgi:hypothetical protein